MLLATLVMGFYGLLWVVMGCYGLLWVVMLWVVMGFYGLLWVVMGHSQTYGLGILQIFCEFLIKLFKIQKKFLVFGYGFVGRE